MFGQDPARGSAGAVGTIGAKDGRFRDRFAELLLRAPPVRNLEAGWQLAADLGRPVVPLLWEMLLAERANFETRLGVLVAAMLAGGPAEDERVFGWLEADRLPQERVMAAMVLALQPQRARPMRSFWTRLLGPGRQPEQVLAVAARLAAARFPAAADAAPSSRDEDAGVLAAAAFAGISLSPATTTRWFDPRSGERHAELFWRGAWLGRLRDPDWRPTQDPWLDRAREVMQTGGDQLAAARRAAALFRGRLGDVPAPDKLPPGELLALLAAEPATATLLQPWLAAVPSPQNEAPDRLAVAYVLARSTEQVLAERALWSQAPSRRIIALALALRLFGEVAPAPIDVRLPSLPEWGFVVAATGGRMEPDADPEDPLLAQAMRLLRDDRLPRQVARQVLEEALWRSGAHPGLGLFEAQVRLVRDLLVTGSHEGTKYAPTVPLERRYRAAGFGPDDKFYSVAIAALDFLSRPRLPIPPECRLR